MPARFSSLAVLLLLLVIGTISAIMTPIPPRLIQPKTYNFSVNASPPLKAIPIDKILPYKGFNWDPHWNNRLQPIDPEFSFRYLKGFVHIAFSVAYHLGTCFRAGDEVNINTVEQREIQSFSRLLYQPICTWSEHGVASWDAIEKQGGIQALKPGMRLVDEENFAIEVQEVHQGALKLRFMYKHTLEDLKKDYKHLQGFYDYLDVQDYNEGKEQRYIHTFLVQPFIQYVYHATGTTKWTKDFPVAVCNTMDLKKGSTEGDVGDAIFSCDWDAKGKICSESSCGDSAHVVGSCGVETLLSTHLKDVHISKEQDSYPIGFKLRQVSSTKTETSLHRSEKLGIISDAIPEKARTLVVAFNLIGTVCNKDETKCATYTMPYDMNGQIITSKSGIIPELDIDFATSPLDPENRPLPSVDVLSEQTSTWILIARNMGADMRPVMSDMVVKIVAKNERGEPQGDIMEDEDVAKYITWCNNRDESCQVAEEYRNMAEPMIFLSFNEDGHKKYFVDGRGGWSYDISWEARFEVRKPEQYQVQSESDVQHATVGVKRVVGEDLRK